MRFIKLSLISALFFILTRSAAYSVQTIDGSGGPITVELDSNGESGGVSFINQAIGECTLSVSQSGTINQDNNANGISTDANLLGNVNFNQASASVNVNGKVGDSSFYLDNIQIGDGNVNFSDRVFCKTLTFSGGGKGIFNRDLFLGSGGAVFNAFGILILKDNVVATGAIGNSTATGQLHLGIDSTVNGNVAVQTVAFVASENPDLKAGIINGNMTAAFIDAGNGGINVNGDVSLAGARISVNDGIGIVPLIVYGNATYTSPIYVDWKFPLEQAPHGPTNGQAVFANSGTSGAQIIVTSNDWRVYFSGQNTNGIITVTGYLTSPPANPSFETGWWIRGIPFNEDPLYKLLTVAYAYPGSDLDFIEGQLGSPTYQGYVDYLYQLYPAPALVGVARESFNTTKQFQRIYLEHLQRDRSLCARQKLCGSKDECVDQCKGLKVWTDGFKYYGKRDNQRSGKGYQANTSGATIGVEQPINEWYRCGGGLGYAYSSIRKARLNEETRPNHTHVHQYEGTFYSTFDKAHWFTDIGLSFAWNHYEGKRHINFHSINRTARSEYNGTEYSGFIDTGYQYCANRFEITPIASLIYSYLHINSHKESGAKTLNLRFTGQNYQFLESSLGLKTAYDYETSWGFFIPEIRAMWLYDFFRESVNVKASYSKLGAAVGSFRNKGPHTDRNTLNVGGSLTFLRNSCLSMTLDYDYELSNHYFDQQGLVEFSYIF
ncbi:MAG: autotransporter domain-containing protein [Parachlamydiales bacterium]